MDGAARAAMETTRSRFRAYCGRCSWKVPRPVNYCETANPNRTATVRERTPTSLRTGQPAVRGRAQAAGAAAHVAVVEAALGRLGAAVIVAGAAIGLARGDAGVALRGDRDGGLGRILRGARRLRPRR